jgi:hypothetical protein
MHPLSKHRFYSGFADYVIKELPDKVAIEVARLSVFNCFSCETDRPIRVRRNLLDITAAKAKEISEANAG